MLAPIGSEEKWPGGMVDGFKKPLTKSQMEQYNIKPISVSTSRKRSCAMSASESSEREAKRICTAVQSGNVLPQKSLASEQPKGFWVERMKALMMANQEARNALELERRLKKASLNATI